MASWIPGPAETDLHRNRRQMVEDMGGVRGTVYASPCGRPIRKCDGMMSWGS